MPGCSVFVEEKGVQAGTFLAHGSLWVRSASLQEGLERLQGPVGWSHIDADNVALYEELLSQFFAADGVMAHMLITRLATSQTAPRSSARRSLGMLLRYKARFFAGTHRVHVVSEEPRLGQILALGPEHELQLLNDHPAARLGTLLAELIVSAWADLQATEPQARVQAALASRLGWPDLRSDTSKHEWKLNVWAYYDPTVGVPRDFQTRAVTLSTR